MFYRMATKAYHKLGDISRSKSELCVINSEDKDNFYGNWVEGFGFINVRFPKNTTRKLTDEEKKKFIGSSLWIGGSPCVFKFTDNDFEY